MVAVLFVCLGNICRSPMAHAVLQHLVDAQGLTQFIEHVDSCGTGAWHEGNQPDVRTMRTLRRHGIPFRHAARQFKDDDYDDYDLILAMDHSNLAEVLAGKPSHCRARVRLFGDYSSANTEAQHRIIRDPYYEYDGSGFELAYQQCLEFSMGLIDELRRCREVSLK